MQNLPIEIIADLLTILISLSTLYRYQSKQTNWLMNGEQIKQAVADNKLYLLIQFLTNIILLVLFNATYREFGIIHHIRLLILVNIMFPMANVDSKYQIIPNNFLIVALIMRILLLIPELLIMPQNTVSLLISSLLGALIIGGFFGILKIVFKGSIGMGDIKLFVVMALFQGLWGALSSVFCSLLTAFVYSIWLLITRKKSKSDSISFGPMILIGTICSIMLTGM